MRSFCLVQRSSLSVAAVLLFAIGIYFHGWSLFSSLTVLALCFDFLPQKCEVQRRFFTILGTLEGRKGNGWLDNTAGDTLFGAILMTRQ